MTGMSESDAPWSLAPMSRRTFVGAGVASLASMPNSCLGADGQLLPLARDLEGPTLVRASGAEGIARIERLGSSRGGRPIDLVSVGSGSRAVLIVGAPHPNEPIGCATVVRLLTRLARDRALRERGGWSWHFIPAIDIDGIAYNEGWFRGQLTLPRYLHGFYRPPFALQPEYAFPLELPGYRFEKETPETRCWQTALDHLRPRLQCSLHGSDTGGAFFIVTRCLPRLCAELGGLAKERDITLDTAGDTSVDLARFGPGVFGFPSVRDMIARAIASGSTAEAAWGAGDSSDGYSEKRYGTFNMVPEVPLWRDAREGDLRPSGRTVGDVLEDAIRLTREDAKLLKPALPVFEARAESDLAKALLTSVKSAVLDADGAIDELEQVKMGSGSRRVLSYADLVQYESWTAMFRTLAMGDRLARVTGAHEVAHIAEHRLAKRIAAFRRVTRLMPVPLSASTGLQMSAILSTARGLQ
jgi:Zinc carboxypeptidase